jgi:hypothetical protein
MPKSAAMLVTAVAKISRNMWSMAWPMFRSHWVAIEFPGRVGWGAFMLGIVHALALPPPRMSGCDQAPEGSDFATAGCRKGIARIAGLGMTGPHVQALANVEPASVEEREQFLA